MSINSNYKISWDDIKEIFTNLNTTRQKYGYSSLTIPDKKEQIIKTDIISTLNNGTSDLASNSELSSLVELAEIPDISSLIKPAPLKKLNTTISNLYTCAQYNGTNFSGYNGTNFSGYNGTNFSGYNSTNFSVYGTNFSGYNSTNFSGYNSTNFSVYGSNFSGYNSTNFSVYGSNFSGYNSSNNSWSGYTFYYTGEYYTFKSSYNCSSVNSSV